VKRLEPAVVGVAAFIRFAQGQHRELLKTALNFNERTAPCDAMVLPSSFKLFEIK
jgi:hypothetical protein